MNAARREELIRALPYARRFARAITGSQTSGNRLVTECLKAAATEDLGEASARLALYRGISTEFARLSPSTHTSSGSELTDQQRQLLLLTSLEELPMEQAAWVLGLSQDEAETLLAEGRSHLRSAAVADVLIIEDEPIIAMDIEELVRNCGHRVIGVASSEREAVEMARLNRPGLILADINLGAGGDGMQAVARIMQSHYSPVIFVTAYPERLLTGEAAEPTYVITKPFEPMTLAITTYQAVSGGVDLD